MRDSDDTKLLQAAIRSDRRVDAYVRKVIAGILEKALNAKDPATFGFALWVCGRLGKDFLGDEDLVRSLPMRAVQLPQSEDEDR